MRNATSGDVVALGRDWRFGQVAIGGECRRNDYFSSFTYYRFMQTLLHTVYTHNKYMSK